MSLHYKFNAASFLPANGGDRWRCSRWLLGGFLSCLLPRRTGPRLSVAKQRILVPIIAIRFCCLQHSSVYGICQLRVFTQAGDFFAIDRGGDLKGAEGENGMHSVSLLMRWTLVFL